MLRTLCRPTLLSRRSCRGRRPGDRRSERTDPRSLSVGDSSTCSAEVLSSWQKPAGRTASVPDPTAMIKSDSFQKSWTFSRRSNTRLSVSSQRLELKFATTVTKVRVIPHQRHCTGCSPRPPPSQTPTPAAWSARRSPEPQSGGHPSPKGRHCARGKASGAPMTAAAGLRSHKYASTSGEVETCIM